LVTHKIIFTFWIAVILLKDQQGQSMDANGSKKHNKSGSSRLAIVDLDKVDLEAVKKALGAAGVHHAMRLGRNECRLMGAGDGRVSVRGKKVAYGYQVVALEKFGEAELTKVSATKSEEGALTISHLCGTAFCLNADHIVLEAKTVNDERTKCHFVMQVADDLGRLPALRELEVCPHLPACGST
jgi:hypothetical protein